MSGNGLERVGYETEPTVVVVGTAVNAESELGHGDGGNTLHATVVQPLMRSMGHLLPYRAVVRVALEATVAAAGGALGRARRALAEVAVTSALIGKLVMLLPPISHWIPCPQSRRVGRRSASPCGDGRMKCNTMLSCRCSKTGVGAS